MTTRKIRRILQKKVARMESKFQFPLVKSNIPQFKVLFWWIKFNIPLFTSYFGGQYTTDEETSWAILRNIQQHFIIDYKKHSILYTWLEKIHVIKALYSKFFKWVIIFRKYLPKSIMSKNAILLSIMSCP